GGGGRGGGGPPRGALGAHRARAWHPGPGAGLRGAAAPGAGGAGAVYGLDIGISAPQRIFLRGRGLDAELGGALRLRGTTADPVPEGRFDLVRGRLDILGRRLDLVEGWAQLDGGLDPQLLLSAQSEAPDGTRVTITLSGRASALDLSLSSQPQLPEDEILARLFFGRGIDRISPLQAAQLASALADLAGGGTGGGVVGRLREGFGLDDLDVTTEEGGGATVRAGRYLTENVYTDVTIGSDGRSTVTINLDLPRGVTARGSIDAEGRSGIGLFLERDY
ncbi:MAG: translocation/assembly module TamB domain-containing protein, partial [Rhodobacteraceae bacterium]|nr:translocation/assembly module TamB domain-containing protein [Paracoccaceae bacterium]